MNLNNKCKLFYGALYMIFYPCLIMFSQHLFIRGYSSENVAMVVSVCYIVAMILKPIASLGFDNGKCRLTTTILTLCIIAGNFYLYFTKTTSFISAVIYGILVFTVCEVLSEDVDAWVVKLSQIDKSIDYSKCRSYGSLGFALMSLVYGIVLDRFGMIVAPIITTLFALIIILIAFSLPEIRIDQEKSSFKETKATVLNKKYLSFMGLFALGLCAISLCDNYAGIVILEKGGTTVHTGVYDFARCIVETLVMMNVSKLIDRFGSYPIMAFGMIGMFIKPLALALAPDAVTAVCTCFTQAFGFPLIISSKVEIAKEIIPAKHMAFCLAIGSVFGSLLYSLVINPIMALLIKQGTTASALAITSSITLISFVGFVIMAKKNKNAA